MKYFFKPDKIVIVISLLCIVALFFMIRYTLNVEKWYTAITTIVVIGLFGFFLLKMPCYTKITNDTITIKQLIGSKKIKKEEIKIIESIDKNDLSGSIRKIGNGGFFGYVGSFYSSELGNYNMIAINLSELAQIKLKNGKTYVINYPKKLLL